MIKKKLNSIALLPLLFLICSASYAQIIATCKSFSGYTLYHDSLAKRHVDSGFETDQISGVITLKRLSKDSYDILVLDSRGTIMSMTQSGGRVILHRSTKNETTLVHINGGLTELYTVYTTGENKYHLDLLQSRGDAEMSPKSALLTGDCSFFNPLAD